MAQNFMVTPTNLKDWQYCNSFLKYHHKKPGFFLLLNIFVTFAVAGGRHRKYIQDSWQCKPEIFALV